MRYFVGNSNTVFDLGMNNGDDTEYYIKKGYRVVAVEANSILCGRAEQRFAREVAQGSLVIVNAAIWDAYTKKTFFVNLENDHWSSLEKGWAGRDDSRFTEMEVECVTLGHLFALYGVPRYLKIDVEGVDDLVLKQLMDLRYVPLYVSVEDCRFGYEYMSTLRAVGYDGFKLLDQSTVGSLTDGSVSHSFKSGSSGPFGEGVPGEWLSHDRIVQQYSTTVRDLQGTRLALRTHWWDIHARCHDPKAIV
ncbi:MAG: FkbM family methyltransferase [Desulfocapsaceae bacterium]|nr:FkbM family methyltransferase [Desulfocapsaceae bacterium]